MPRYSGPEPRCGSEREWRLGSEAAVRNGSGPSGRTAGSTIVLPATVTRRRRSATPNGAADRSETTESSCTPRLRAGRAVTSSTRSPGDTFVTYRRVRATCGSSSNRPSRTPRARFVTIRSTNASSPCATSAGARRSISIPRSMRPGRMRPATSVPNSSAQRTNNQPACTFVPSRKRTPAPRASPAARLRRRTVRTSRRRRAGPRPRPAPGGPPLVPRRRCSGPAAGSACARARRAPAPSRRPAARSPAPR